jgi:hypothetical protein
MSVDNALSCDIGLYIDTNWKDDSMALVPPKPPVTLLSRSAVADELTKRGYPIRPNTLAHKAVYGGGPPCVRFGNRVLYDLDKAIAWAKARLIPVPPVHF